MINTAPENAEAKTIQQVMMLEVNARQSDKLRAHDMIAGQEVSLLIVQTKRGDTQSHWRLNGERVAFARLRKLLVIL